MADLLGELAARAGKRLLAVGQLALDNRPRALVLARPERAAGVAEQYLEDAVALAVEQQSGGDGARQ
jgi:hypothetical protein